MRKFLIVALLAAIAPFGIAHAASKPTPTKAPMKMTGKMAGKMSGKTTKTTGKKTPVKKPMGKKATTPKTMPMRDPKTGRFMKKPTPVPTMAKTKK